MTVDQLMDNKVITADEAKKMGYGKVKVMYYPTGSLGGWIRSAYEKEITVKRAIEEGYLTPVKAVEEKRIDLKDALALKWLKIEDAIKANLITAEKAISQKLITKEHATKVGLLKAPEKAGK